MLSESISKLDKYRKALISSKKRQRNDLLSNERSGGASVSKVGSQILRNPNDHATQRFEDKTTRTTGLGLKKRIRTSMVFENKLSDLIFTSAFSIHLLFQRGYPILVTC
ncbi:hypothetical protein CsSME_00046675 [Camellia sinensis var. sinensis]